MLRTLFGSLREHKKGSAITIALSILEVAFEIFIPLCMAELIDKGIELGEMRAVWKFGIILLVFAILQLLTGILSAHIAAKTSVGFAANLRQDMYDNVQTFAFSNIDKFSTASIVTRLTTDVTNIQNAYQMLMYRDGEEEIYITSLSFLQEPELGEGEGADEISQYPLEDILDKFYCYVSDFYKELNTSDSKICYLEFASPDISDIRALRGIIGKHVYNKEYEEGGETYTELVIE